MDRDDFVRMTKEIKDSVEKKMDSIPYEEIRRRHVKPARKKEKWSRLSLQTNREGGLSGSFFCFLDYY